MTRLIAVLLCAGCAAPVPPSAPDALDANVKWFWVNGDSASDDSLIEAAQKLAVAGKADTRTTPFKGQHRERLTSEELAPVGLQQNDPSTARGLLVVNLFCARGDAMTLTRVSRGTMRASSSGVLPFSGCPSSEWNE